MKRRIKINDNGLLYILVNKIEYVPNMEGRGAELEVGELIEIHRDSIGHYEVIDKHQVYWGPYLGSTNIDLAPQPRPITEKQSLAERARSLIVSDIVHRSTVDKSDSFHEFALHSISEDCSYIEDTNLEREGSRPATSTHNGGQFMVMYQIISYNVHYRIMNIPTDWSWTYTS